MRISCLVIFAAALLATTVAKAQVVAQASSNKPQKIQCCCYQQCKKFVLRCAPGQKAICSCNNRSQYNLDGSPAPSPIVASCSI